MGSTTAGDVTTRTRLLDACLRLVADHGYERTTVGEIERAAGLAPRSGALYQYFSGKEELLHAAVRHAVGVVDELAPVMEMLPLGDLRAELTLLARWNLQSLSRREHLNRFLAREAHRLPEELRDELYERLVAQPYALATAWLKARFDEQDAPDVDVEALTLILIQSMAGYRAMRSTFGRVAGDVDDERFVRTWVDVALCLAPEARSDVSG